MKNLNLKDILLKSLDAKTRTYLMQVANVMSDAVDNEFGIDEHKGMLAQEIVNNAQNSLGYVLTGSANGNKGIFNEDVAPALKYYYLYKLLSGDEFGMNMIKEKTDVEFDKESVKEVIKLLQKLIEE